MLTSDLDFSAILAAAGDQGPSVVQIRAHALNSQTAMNLVVDAIHTHALAIERGVLLSIDEDAARARMLPIRRSS